MSTFFVFEQRGTSDSTGNALLPFERRRKQAIGLLYFCFTAMAEISIRALFTNAAA